MDIRCLVAGSQHLGYIVEVGKNESWTFSLASARSWGLHLPSPTPKTSVTLTQDFTGDWVTDLERRWGFRFRDVSQDNARMNALTRYFQTGTLPDFEELQLSIFHLERFFSESIGRSLDSALVQVYRVGASGKRVRWGKKERGRLLIDRSAAAQRSMLFKAGRVNELHIHANADGSWSFKGFNTIALKHEEIPSDLFLGCTLPAKEEDELAEVSTPFSSADDTLFSFSHVNSAILLPQGGFHHFSQEYIDIMQGYLQPGSIMG